MTNTVENQNNSHTFRLNLTTIQGKITLGFLSLGFMALCVAVSHHLFFKRALDKQQELIEYYKQNSTLKTDAAIAISGDVEALTSIGNIVTYILVAISLLLGVFLAYYITAFILNKLSKVEEKIKSLAEGNLPERMQETDDELVGMLKSGNNLIMNLSQVKKFAQEVGQGHFDSDIVVFNNEGELGKSLAQMRKSLKDVAEEDKVRNWISEGIAKFAHILRQNNSNMEALSQTVISELVKYLKATQGALFILEELHGEPVLEMKACYAYERRKYLHKTVQIGEGMVGQVFLEKETVILTEIPQNYFSITSGLGESLPKSLLIVPLKLNDDVTGILELASLKIFQPHDIQLVEKIAESIASTVSGVKTAEATNRLLQDSLSSGEQLKAQEEELRQNMEEMQATQEQMRRQTDEMAKIQDSLKLEKSMFHVLMEYIPDRLTYKDTESRIIRVNKAKAARFNLSPEEMINKTDFDFFPAEHAAKARLEEKELMAIGKPMLDIQEKVSFDNGDVMFINTSRIPFKDEDGVLIGNFCISKDITQQKLSEASLLSQHQIIKGLLSTMPVFSYKIDRNGKIKDVFLGNTTSLPDDILQLDQKLAKDIIPDIYFVAQKHKVGELFTCEGDIELEGKKVPFKHYILADSIYANAYWAFAIKQ